MNTDKINSSKMHIEFKNKDNKEIFMERLKFKSDILEIEAKRLKEVYEKSKAVYQLKPNKANQKKLQIAFNKYDISLTLAVSTYLEYSRAASYKFSASPLCIVE